MVKSRNQIIEEIEGLFPTDSPYPNTNEIGKILLLQAIEEKGWRTLPIEILERYRQLCVDEDIKQYLKSKRELAKKYGG
jgi:hypothetical protein